MEEMKKENHPEGCKCVMCNHSSGKMCMSGWCGCGCHRHAVARWVLGILLITFIFCAGFWFGNMAAIFRYSGYGDGYGMMHGYRYNSSMMDWNDRGGYGYGYNADTNGAVRGPAMMQGNASSSQTR